MADKKPHFVLVPLMAPGHMIPMIDMAGVLAAHGASVTVIITPANASRIPATISYVEQSRRPIRFVSLPFPAVEFGLPEGFENIDTLQSRDSVKSFYDAARTMLEPLVCHLRSYQPPPSCIVSDNTHHWTHHVAREFGVPRLVFHGFGSFPLLANHNIRSSKIHQTIDDENEPFVVPGMPFLVRVTRAQVRSFFAAPGLEKLRQELKEAESMADGVVVNSFDELDASYTELYGEAIQKKIWTIGPLLLYNRDFMDAAVDEQPDCLTWLDSMKPGSVVYVSFGSLARTNPSQLFEIGQGLEASGCPFVWVIRTGGGLLEVEEWLSAGFEERTRKQGLIIRGWAPQAMILMHRSVGGFMTHCGWNSTLESISAGVPMITWPLFADQFLNEKLIVDILKVGVPVGVKSPTAWGVETDQVLVKSDDVKKAVRTLMEEGEEAAELRKTVKELSEKARRAVEVGGSSYLNLTQLIENMNSGISL